LACRAFSATAYAVSSCSRLNCRATAGIRRSQSGPTVPSLRRSCSSWPQASLDDPGSMRRPVSHRGHAARAAARSVVRLTKKVHEVCATDVGYVGHVFSDQADDPTGCNGITSGCPRCSAKLSS
jgi:hypothetical protein